MKKKIIVFPAVPAVPTEISNGNSEIQLFENEQFGKIRVIMKNGDPWFIAKDVCKCLDLHNPRTSLALLDDDEKDAVHSMDTIGRDQEMTTISESGLYSLILRSRKPEAKQFKRWLDQEVIPVIHSKKHIVPAVPVEINNTNSDIQSFENTQFGKIRVIMKNGDPWFVAKDVCECLSFRDATAGTRGLLDDEKGTHIMCTPGGSQNLIIISESGLYKMILKSRKPEVRRFQNWVTREVLPSIRKTGSYSVSPVQDTKIIQILDNLTTKIDQLALENQGIKEQIKSVKPKVEFYDNFVDPESSTSMNDSAKLIGNIGRNRLFKKLREKRFLMSNNIPYQRYITSGIFKVKGGDRFIPTTYVTPKGLQLIKKMLDDEEKEE